MNQENNKPTAVLPKRRRNGAQKPAATHESEVSGKKRGQPARFGRPKNNKQPMQSAPRENKKRVKPAEKPAEKPAKPATEKQIKGKRGGKPVKIIFLGGVGEIGKNMTAIECGDDIIIIDAGAIFPTEETPGFDLIVPDITYLLDNAKKIRGLILTHGHEDHIGGVPYLLKELKVPVIGTKLTLALVDNKLREHRLNSVKEITVTPGQTIQLGCLDRKSVV